MTICIAALCDDGKKCVVAADREITTISKNQTERKIEVFTDSCIVMGAGDTSQISEIIRRSRVNFDSTKKRSVLEIASIIRDNYVDLHLERAEFSILRPRNLSWKEYKETASKIPNFRDIEGQIWNYGIDAACFLVAGVDDTGAHIYRIFYLGIGSGNWIDCWDKSYMKAIGSGNGHAEVALALLEHHKSLTVNQTLYNVYSAKKIAEIAPYVGPSTDIAIIENGKVNFLTNDQVKKLTDLRDKTLKSSMPKSPEIEGL